MSSTLRRLAGTAALAVAASALTLPLAAPARATVGDQTSFLVVDTDGDGTYGLYSMPTPTGAQTALPGLADSPLRDISALSATRAGGRMVFVEDFYASATATSPYNEQVVVRDISGRQVRVIASVNPSTEGLFSPAISPDGSTVVFQQLTDAGFVLRKADVGTGATTNLSSGIFDAVFADSDTLFGFDTSGHAIAMPVAGGSTSPINIPDGASEIRVAPAGQFVAWSLDKSTTAATAVSDIQYATLDLSSNTVGVASTLATGLNNHSPAWETSALEYVHDDGAGGPGEVHQLNPANPQATDIVPGATPSLDEQEIAITMPRDTVAPLVVPTATVGFTLSGTSATIRWQLPADTDGDRSGVMVSREGKSFYVPAPLSYGTDSGLALGTTYHYTVTIIDRSGNLASSGATRSMTAIQALPAFSDPTSVTATKAPFKVTFATGAPSAATFDVDYLPVGTTVWKHWVTGATGAARTFGSAAATGVAATTSTAGLSVTFRAQAHDAFGNSTPVVSSARAVVPWDQTKATLSGGTNVPSGSAWLGSFRKMSSVNHSAKVTLVGNRLQVIGWKCSTCGKFALYDGKTLIATVDTYSSTTKARVVLYTKSWSSIGTHAFTLRPLGTKGRPYVELDGFAMRR